MCWVAQTCPTLQHHGPQPTRLPCGWDSPGKNTGVGCHFLLGLKEWKRGFQVQKGHEDCSGQRKEGQTTAQRSSRRAPACFPEYLSSFSWWKRELTISVAHSKTQKWKGLWRCRTNLWFYKQEHRGEGRGKKTPRTLGEQSPARTRTWDSRHHQGPFASSLTVTDAMWILTKHGCCCLVAESWLFCNPRDCSPSRKPD